MRSLLSSLALASMCLGCATTYEAKWNEAPTTATTTTADDTTAQLATEGDALWAERGDKAKLVQALEKWEAAAAKAPSAELYAKLARGHYLLGDGYYVLDGNDEARDAEYQKGLDAATKGLKLSAPEFARAMADGKKHGEAILLAGKDAIPSMYWYASNLGKWAAAKGFVTKLKYKDDIKATIDHIKDLDDTFFYAAPYRYLGGYEAATAGLAGGSLEKSQEYFQKSVQMAPNYLGTKVLWADFLCTKKQDKDTFKKLLDEVVAADPAADPAIEPENKIEQQKAKKLLAKIDDLF